MDLVLDTEEVRAMAASASASLREAGIADVLDGSAIPAARPLSTFRVTSFHPKCGGPIRTDALRETDGSL
jgi:hypothetical protein